VDPDHQRGPPGVAESSALAVAAAIARSVPRHRDPVAASEEQRASPPGDRERYRRLAGRAAAVLQLQLPRARADQLELPGHVGRRRVPGIEADQRGCERLGEHPATVAAGRARAT